MTRGENDHVIMLLKEMLGEHSKDGLLDSVAALQKRQETAQRFLKVTAAHAGGSQHPAAVRLDGRRDRVQQGSPRAGRPHGLRLIAYLQKQRLIITVRSQMAEPVPATSTVFRRHTSARQFKMTTRQQSSASLNRQAPDFFKDTRVQTCSSIKLVDGVPKAVSFPAASQRARSARIKYDRIKRAQTAHPVSIYQYPPLTRNDFIDFRSSGSIFTSHFAKPLVRYDPNSVRNQMRDTSELPDMKYVQSVRIGTPQ